MSAYHNTSGSQSKATSEAKSGPTLVDCGCEARVHGDGSGIEISYCPLHDEAESLASALRRALDFIGTDPRYTSQGHTGAVDILNAGRLALRKAGES